MSALDASRLDLIATVQRLSLATRSANLGTFDWDIPRDTRYFDETFHRLVGLDPERFDGSVQAFYRAIHPDDVEQVRSSLPRALAQGEYETEYRAVWPDGSTHHIAARGRVTLDDQGRPARLNGVIWDISAQKEAEAERRRYQERTVQAQKLEALGVMVAGIAHNLNTVLAVILGTVSLGGPGPGDALDPEACRRIAEACRRGRTVVKSLVQFSKPTLSTREPFELGPLMEEVRVLLENTTQNRVRVVTGLEGGPSWIQGDAGSINLALVSLCFNSVEAMPGGGVLTLRAAADGDWVDLSVEDDGRGMPPEVLERAMEPFFTTKDASSGAGLGLSTVYGVIRAHGGTMVMASQPGRGTMVTLRLPRIPAPVRGGTAAPPPLSTCPRRVLLVDDEEDVRLLMSRMLTKAGVREVRTAAGGEEALADLRSGPLPDLVVLDQNMPGMTGLQTMVRMRELAPDLPILFSSGQPDLEEWECLRMPGVGAISKPFSLAEIQAKLAQFSGVRP